MIFNLYKQRGETPLECVQRFREKFPEYDKIKPLERSKVVKWTYMGRLDPMAEGVMLVANGEDVHKKEEFIALDKDYDFVVLFGFATDTYDVLGKILRVSKINDLKEMDLIKVAKLYEGEREQKYPEFSSKVIAAKRKSSKKFISSPESFSSENPRIFVAQSRLSSDDFLPKKVTIHNLRFHGLDELRSKELFGRLLMDISKVKGDFRQNETLILWRKFLLGSDPSLVIREGLHGSEGVSYFLGKFSAHVSSGTYIRSLVNDMGKTLGLCTTTLSIRRTRVGDYRIEDSIKF